MFNNTSVFVCLVSLISGSVCIASKERNQESKLQKLIRNFEEARQIKSRTDYDKLREIEIDLLTKRIVNKMLAENVELSEESTTNEEEEPQLHEYLRQLEDMLGDNVVNDLLARTEDLINDNVDMVNYKKSVDRRCWWCNFGSTKLVGGLKTAKNNPKLKKIKVKIPKKSPTGRNF